MKIAFKFDSGRVVCEEVFERTFTIGRSDACRVVIDSEHFSKEHCLIELIDDLVYVTDLNSKNGIYINHIRIPKKMRVTFDRQVPLYMGECFLTIDMSFDSRDPDYLSIQTHNNGPEGKTYRTADAPRPMILKPKATPKPPQNHFLHRRTLLILIVIVTLACVLHFQLNRDGQPKRQSSGTAP